MGTQGTQVLARRLRRADPSEHPYSFRQSKGSPRTQGCLKVWFTRPSRTGALQQGTLPAAVPNSGCCHRHPLLLFEKTWSTQGPDSYNKAHLQEFGELLQG